MFQQAKWCLCVLTLLGLSCQAPVRVGDELLELDYFFGPDYIQIQGHARLPRALQLPTDSSDSPPSRSRQGGDRKGVDQKRFLSYTERRRLCKERALVNAHTKWLSITERQWLPQSEWKLRLKLGDKSDWNECIQGAQVMDLRFDRPKGCRLVVRYFCDPRDY